MPRTLLLSPARVRRTVARLAYEVVERNRGADALEQVDSFLESEEPGEPEVHEFARALVKVTLEFFGCLEC